MKDNYHSITLDVAKVGGYYGFWGYKTFIVANRLDDDSVMGFRVFLKKKLKYSATQKENPEFSFCKNGIIFQNLGEISDNFIEFLSHRYNVNNYKKFTKKSVIFSTTTLNDEPFDVSKDPIHLKLVYEKIKKQYLYGELYLSIDLKNKQICMLEKDELFWEKIIEILSN